MPKKKTETTITITLDRGLAKRSRLPLRHVIDILRELQEAIRAVGIEVQREKGVKEPDGEFGIELLADSKGIVFHKGSIKSNAAITQDAQNGAEAFRRVMKTANILESRRPFRGLNGASVIVRHFAIIGVIQKNDQTELKLALSVPKKRIEKARFGEAGIEHTEKLRTSASSIEGLTIYGRLRELRDQSTSERGGKFIWGELVSDAGEKWRVRFKSTEESDILHLFRKRVAVTGRAEYYEAYAPRLVAETYHLDKQRDYEAAFEELYGMDADIYGKEDFGTILREMKGEN
jgi:hypothetical protein